MEKKGKRKEHEKAKQRSINAMKSLSKKT